MVSCVDRSVRTTRFMAQIVLEIPQDVKSALLDFQASSGPGDSAQLPTSTAAPLQIIKNAERKASIPVLERDGQVEKTDSICLSA